MSLCRAIAKDARVFKSIDVAPNETVQQTKEMLYGSIGLSGFLLSIIFKMRYNNFFKHEIKYNISFGLRVK